MQIHVKMTAKRDVINYVLVDALHLVHQIHALLDVVQHVQIHVQVAV